LFTVEESYIYFYKRFMAVEAMNFIVPTYLMEN